ncbi:MAG: hypothetical protein DI537_10560 [Stutzerimonas stutzeri]|nr:MAG: hypothetical protein DI537_10560 [Stutzerimonas stutzeri]
MRVYLSSTVLFEEAPKALKSSLRTAGVEISELDSIEAIARTLGFDSAPDWVLKTSVAPPSPLDHEVSEAEQDARRTFQARHLSGYLGIRPDLARQIIETAQPSGSRRGEPRRIPSLIDQAVLDAMKALSDRMVLPRIEETTIDFAIESLVKTRPRLTPKLTIGEVLTKKHPGLHTMVGILREVEPDLDVFEASGWGMVGFVVERMIAEIFGCPFDQYARGIHYDGHMITPLAQLSGMTNPEFLRAVTLQRIPVKLAAEFVEQSKRQYGAQKVANIIQKSRNEFGFYGWFPGIEESDGPQSQCWEPLQGEMLIASETRFENFQLGGYDYAIEVVREHVEEEEPLRSYFIKAIISRENISLGAFHGQIITCSEPDYIVPKDLLEFAGSHSEQLFDIAIQLQVISNGCLDELFTVGDILIIRHIEVAQALLPKGFGKTFLQGVVKALKKRHKRIAHIGYVVKPLQFRYPFDERLPPRIKREFSLASAKLRTHYANIARECGLRGDSIPLNPESAGDEDDDEFDDMMMMPPFR